jgi:hypothetical protein
MPYFVTGSKGNIGIWLFETLNKEMEFHSEQIKENIHTIKFNKFGDKIGGINTSGDFFIWKLN